MALRTPPGATPLKDISGLIPGHITNEEELFESEFANINIAIKKYFLGVLSEKKAPFTLEWLYKVHKEMFENVWIWAGIPRKTNPNIGIPYPHIQTSLSQLLENLNYWEKQTSMNILEIVTRIHHEFVRIHPFPNGNGRWARLVSNIYLKKKASPLVKWPEKTLQKESPMRNKYIEALKSADEGNIQPLLALHQTFLEKETS